MGGARSNPISFAGGDTHVWAGMDQQMDRGQGVTGPAAHTTTPATCCANQAPETVRAFLCTVCHRDAITSPFLSR